MLVCSSFIEEGASCFGHQEVRTLFPSLGELRRAALTLERLREPHGSVPHNPLLAEPLYLTKYIEQMGTGTRDIIRRCRDAGLPEPEFRVTDGFTLTIRRTQKTAAANYPEETSVKTSVKTPERILRLLEAHPTMTLAEVAAEIGKSVRTVELASSRLVKEGRLKYVGPQKGGHWDVLK